ncbi:MAG TPA: cysteine--tRNA ligase [Opitutaceae bacterium]|jgi:cysteinyl-tRNA synthetase|nr:cysteine--tRNA ligase [Opitutaceae bacterium]
MPIKLFDSLTREIRELRRPDPNNPKDVFSFYNCGPTVYAPAHIGNFRTFIINDVLRRLLELEYGPSKVKHVRNLTDVDDRTIGQTQKEKLPLGEITKKWTDLFHADCDALNCLRPHVEPTATGHIREQVDMIEVLMQKGNAYRAPDGSVYFKVSSFPNYGALSRVKERELKVTNSVFDADHKDEVGDFALWKAYKPAEDGDVKWPGPRGASEGRPGWHIECSAMIKTLLGDTIDLHTGGVDLLFPHHENEIAQSECCNGTKFSRHWYHSEHLLVEGTTMSKSKGNYYTLGDLVEKGYSPMAVRYALLMGHPRKQLNFTLDSLHAAESALGKLRSHFDSLQIFSNQAASTQSSSHYSEVIEALCDDLNTPAALGALFSSISNWGKNDPSAADFLAFKQVLEVLGLELKKTDEAAPIVAQQLAEKRWAAKKAKDFAGADALRKELTAAGWSMLDGKDGYKLEKLKG